MRMRGILFLSAFVMQLQAQDLAPALQAATPDVDRLIQVMQPKIALERAKGILPASKPAYSGADFSSLQKSTQNYRALAGMYLLQGRAAAAAGAWEEAQQAYVQGLSIAQENQANYSQYAQITVDSLLKASTDAEAFKKENAAQIKDMLDSAKNIKSNPLEILKLQQAIQEQEESITRTRQSVSFVTGAKKDLATDIQSLTEAKQNLDKALQSEKETIATFNATKKKKGNAPWVASILADKNSADRYPTAKEQSDLLHRLTVLDPANAQVSAKLNALRQGTPAFVAAKVPVKAPAKAAKKKK